MSVTKVEPLKVINIDDVPYAVDDLSQDVQDRVEIYNSWRQEHADQRMELLKTENAMNNISREIISLIRAERAKEEAEAKGKEAAPEAEASAEGEAPAAVNE